MKFKKSLAYCELYQSNLGGKETHWRQLQLQPYRIASPQ